MTNRPHARTGGWRIGDVVRVAREYRLTTLGEGVIVEVEEDNSSGWVKSALVRFEHGPANGVWYSVATLEHIRDLEGRPLTPDGRPAPEVPIFREMPSEEVQAPARQPVAKKTPPVPRLVARASASAALAEDPEEETPAAWCFSDEVQSPLAPGETGFVINAPPSFPDGTLWPQGWLRIIWLNRATWNVHESYVERVSTPDSLPRGQGGRRTFEFRVKDRVASCFEPTRLGVIVRRWPRPSKWFVVRWDVGREWAIHGSSLLPILAAPDLGSSSFCLGARVRVVTAGSRLQGQEGRVVGFQGSDLQVLLKAGERPTFFLPNELEAAGFTCALCGYQVLVGEDAYEVDGYPATLQTRNWVHSECMEDRVSRE